MRATFAYFDFLNSDWLQHVHSVCRVFEYIIERFPGNLTMPQANFLQCKEHIPGAYRMSLKKMQSLDGGYILGMEKSGKNNVHF